MPVGLHPRPAPAVQADLQHVGHPCPRERETRPRPRPARSAAPGGTRTGPMAARWLPACRPVSPAAQPRAGRPDPQPPAKPAHLPRGLGAYLPRAGAGGGGCRRSTPGAATRPGSSDCPPLSGVPAFGEHRPVPHGPQHDPLHDSWYTSPIAAPDPRALMTECQPGDRMGGMSFRRLPAAAQRRAGPHHDHSGIPARPPAVARIAAIRERPQGCAARLRCRGGRLGRRRSWPAGWRPGPARAPRPPGRLAPRRPPARPRWRPPARRVRCPR
jgi:hypothetical protein